MALKNKVSTGVWASISELFNLELKAVCLHGRQISTTLQGGWEKRYNYGEQDKGQNEKVSQGEEAHAWCAAASWILIGCPFSVRRTSDFPSLGD